MDMKICKGPICGGLSRSYREFDPDVGEPDLLAKFCRSCMAELAHERDQEERAALSRGKRVKLTGREAGERTGEVKTSREKKCADCGADFHDDSRTATRKWCDKCSPAHQGKKRSTKAAKAVAPRKVALSPKELAEARISGRLRPAGSWTLPVVVTTEELAKLFAVALGRPDEALSRDIAKQIVANAQEQA